MCKGGNLCLQLIFLSMDQFAVYVLTERIIRQYSHKFIIRLTNRFNLGHLNLCKGGNCKLSKESDFM